MNLQDISTQLLFMTTPIYTKKASGETSVGTAFFFNKSHPTDPNQFMPVLVTNKHVINGAIEGVIQIYRADASGNPITNNRISVNIDKSFFDKFTKSADYDIAIIPITGLFEHAAKIGDKIFYRAADKSIVPNEKQLGELGAMEDIVFIGYPSGIIDTNSGLPVIRKGITATPLWANFEGKKEFLIDAGVFPGSSGSPVFILNQGSYATGANLVVGTRVMLVGLIYQTIQTGSDKAYLGLGKAISSIELLKIINSLG